ncbi:MAG: hypothetical protein OEU46_22760 [Alphaproteobacteria bacterium]|nr:hypothetical protein [Alphaproteobacteria bacterium]
MGPIEFIVSNPAYVVGGILLLGMVYLLFRSSKRSLDRAAAPRRKITYECVVTPALEADDKLRSQFSEFDSSGPLDGLRLVRFGLFNWGTLDLEPDHIQEPIAVRFGDQDEVIYAAFGEVLKTKFDMPEPPVAEGSIVRFAPFSMSARGTVIFNFVVRGAAEPIHVEGFIENGGPIRRLT